MSVQVGQVRRWKNGGQRFRVLFVGSDAAFCRYPVSGEEFRAAVASIEAHSRLFDPRPARQLPGVWLNVDMGRVGGASDTADVADAEASTDRIARVFLPSVNAEAIVWCDGPLVLPPDEVLP